MHQGALLETTARGLVGRWYLESTFHLKSLGADVAFKPLTTLTFTLTIIRATRQCRGNRHMATLTSPLEGLLKGRLQPYQKREKEEESCYAMTVRRERG